MEEKNFIDMSFDEIFPPLIDMPSIQDSVYGSNELTEDDSQHMKYDTECDVHSSKSNEHDILYGSENASYADSFKVEKTNLSENPETVFQSAYIDPKKIHSEFGDIKKDISVETRDGNIKNGKTSEDPKSTESDITIITIGIFSIVFCFVPFFGAIIPCIGIIKGFKLIKRKRQAGIHEYPITVIGMVLCCMALCVGSFVVKVIGL